MRFSELVKNSVKDTNYRVATVKSILTDGRIVVQDTLGRSTQVNNTSNHAVSIGATALILKSEIVSSGVGREKAITTVYV